MTRSSSWDSSFLKLLAFEEIGRVLMAGKSVVRIGDIIEIETDGGFGYAIYTHDDPRKGGMGSLIRVLEGISDDREPNPLMLLQRKELFAVFLPVKDYLKSNDIRIVDHVDVLPPGFEEFPTFRCQPRCQDGSVWLWNGKDKWRAHLTPEQEALSTASIANIAWLKAKIEQQRRPGPEDICKLPAPPKP